MFKLTSSDNTGNKPEALDNTGINPAAPDYWFTCLTWNIEGFSRSKYSLSRFLCLYSSDFVFLAEPMLFQCDVNQEMELLKGDYCFTLNSDDMLDPELPLTQKRANGGTMALWKRNLDQYVTVFPSPSSSILPIVFAPPNQLPALLLTIYLPTAGRDAEFVEEITNLNNIIYELWEKYPDAMLFLRGDANANPKDIKRVDNIGKLCEDWSLIKTSIEHPTYHHFVGEGMSDSELDVLLHSVDAPEELIRIICKRNDPLVTSHHDILLSRFATSCLRHQVPPACHPPAPRVHNTRAKILWSEPGIHAYQSCRETEI